jgi:3-oxosteroid 1-dehydrogenase
MAWDGGRYAFANLPIFFIVDQQFRERYPFCGVLPMMSIPTWMVSEPSLAALARRLGIEEDGLVAAVGRFNQQAREGVAAALHQNIGYAGGAIILANR